MIFPIEIVEMFFMSILCHEFWLMRFCWDFPKDLRSFVDEVLLGFSQEFDEFCDEIFV